MALDILEGEPGGGKSYTAVQEFIIPALRQGRAVVTDIPLVIPEINRITGRDCEDLLWVLREGELGRRPFSSMDDFDPGWSRPAMGPDGPMLNPETKEPLIERALCVVDEAHEVWPASGAAPLSKEWDSFFGKHRHFGLDIVLLTQDAGYVHVSLRKRMRLRYRLVNMAFMGFRAAYFIETYRGQSKTRQTFRIRRYQRRIFRCYNSFTGGGASSGTGAKPRSIFLRWPVFLTVGAVTYGVYGCASGDLLEVPGATGDTSAIHHATQPAPAPAVVPPQSGVVDIVQQAAMIRATADLELARRELAYVQSSVCGAGSGRSTSSSGVAAAAMSSSDQGGSGIDCRLVPAPVPPPRHLFAGAKVRIGSMLVMDGDVSSAFVAITVRREGRDFSYRADALRGLGWRINARADCEVYVEGPWRGVLSCDWLEVPA